LRLIVKQIVEGDSVVAGDDPAPGAIMKQLKQTREYALVAEACPENSGQEAESSRQGGARAYD